VNLNRKLNLVIPLERDDGPVYVHSTPISREVFERYFAVIAKTFGRLMVEGMAQTSPRIAMLMLRKTAQDDGTWAGAAGVELGLVNEIRRLTSVLLPQETGGWQQLPWYDAVREQRLDEEEVAEVENLLAFFTLSAAMRRRKEHGEMMEAMAEAFSLQTTSSTCTEFASSLPTSTAIANTGEKAAGSLIPS
jgi:hypothetical protein